jgi:sugar lactone lactonase YvrE
MDTERRCVGGLIGGGPPFDLPAAAAVEAAGSLIVTDAGLGAVVRADPRTGDRTLVSGCPAIDAQRNCQGTLLGQGPPFRTPSAIAMAADGHLWVGDTLRQAVLQVDPSTGDRTLVSGCTAIDVEGRCVGGLIGRGPPFDFPVALAVEVTGALVVVDAGLGAVMRVNPSTGDRTLVSDASIGRGLPLFFPVAIAVEADESLVVVDRKINAVVRVDPYIGERTIVSTGAE